MRKNKTRAGYKVAASIRRDQHKPSSLQPIPGLHYRRRRVKVFRKPAGLLLLLATKLMRLPRASSAKKSSETLLQRPSCQEESRENANAQLLLHGMNVVNVLGGENTLHQAHTDL